VNEGCASVKKRGVMKHWSLLILVTCLWARQATNQCSGREFQNARHDINNLTLVISNFGTFGQSESGNSGGLWWQFSGYGLTNTYIYGAGVWFGTIDSTADTLVTIGYGPSGGQFEFSPGLGGWSVTDPDAIIYLYPNPWPPNQARLPMAPLEPISRQDSWCVYNDCDSLYHMAEDTRPIGIEIYQTGYAWDFPVLEDAVFLVFQVKNVSGNDLYDCYFSIGMDSDIGNEAGYFANDLCDYILDQTYVIAGDTIHVDDLVYQWQQVPEGGWPEFPGVIGFDLVQTPFDLEWGQDKDGDEIPDQRERDSVYYRHSVPQNQWDVDHDGVPDWRDASENPQLGLTSFKLFTLDLEPSRDNQRYMTMAGHNFVTGQYEPFDSALTNPGDRRFLMSSGPFDLGPDSTATLVLGIMLAEWFGVYQTPDTAIAIIDYYCQLTADMNWLLPGPPPAPSLTCVPGDARITLIWQSAPETTPDPFFDIVGDSGSTYFDPFYRQYDFEGYGVWKSLDGETYELLTRYDLHNDIMFEDTATDIYATNSGLRHYFIDEDVRNGFTYHYALTSYDCNYHAGQDSLGNQYVVPFWLESEKVSVSAIARRDPANYQPGCYHVEAVYGNPVLADSGVDLVITHPLQMTEDPYYLVFGPIEYANSEACYTASLLDHLGDLIDSVRVVFLRGERIFRDFGTRNGLNISVLLWREDIPTGVSIFEDVMVESGTYPESLLVPSSGGTNWAYRGNDFRVYWRALNAGGPVNTVTVVDVYSGDTIPFKPGTTDTLADGWCFESVSQTTDTLVYSNWVAIATRYMYICGGKFRLKPAGGLVPGDPVPSENDVWLVRACADYLPAPANTRLKITPTPAQLTTGEVSLNVKVCPNPYVVTNEWQRHMFKRRLRFINLPSQCTIRVFNINGELVKLIEHHHTSEGGLEGDLGGDEWWDGLNLFRQLVASGVYVFHVQSEVGEQVGKFVVVH